METTKLVIAEERAALKVNLLDAWEKDVPVFTISADSPFGIAAMVEIYQLSSKLPAEKRAEIAAIMRKFELWEETHRV